MDGGSVNVNLPRRWPVDPREKTQQRRLSASRLSNDGYEFPSLNSQVYVSERIEPAGSGRVRARYALKADE